MILRMVDMARTHVRRNTRHKRTTRAATAWAQDCQLAWRLLIFYQFQSRSSKRPNLYLQYTPCGCLVRLHVPCRELRTVSGRAEDLRGKTAGKPRDALNAAREHDGLIQSSGQTLGSEGFCSKSLGEAGKNSDKAATSGMRTASISWVGSCMLSLGSLVQGSQFWHPCIRTA